MQILYIVFAQILARCPVHTTSPMEELYRSAGSTPRERTFCRSLSSRDAF